MEVKKFLVEELSVTTGDVRPVLRCLLHTVLFNRAFGLVTPKEEIIESIDLSYIRCDDLEINKLINSKIDDFLTYLPTKKDPSRGDVLLSFFEKKKKRGGGWFTGGAETHICWEQWSFTLCLIGDGAAIASKEHSEALSSSLRERILYIIEQVDRYKDHVPPVTTKELTPFPYEIQTVKDVKTGWGWLVGGGSSGGLLS